jgi:ribosome modulation factor
VRRREELFAYLAVPGCPRTTNIIESYNSHLQGRLASVKGFQTFATAQRWLNGWMVRRRTKQLTDCRGTFKHLNGHASLELSIKKQARWPGVLTELGVKKIEYFDFEKPQQNGG